MQTKLKNIKHDYTGVGGGIASMVVREGVKNDKSVLKEVESYSIINVAGKHVLDIGAHIGGYCVLAFQLGAKSVTAIEPDPRNLKLLKLNCQKNIPKDRYQILEGAAVGTKFKKNTVTLYTKPTSSRNSVLLKKGVPVDVPALRWSEILKLKKFGAIKLDCEGGEYDLLLGDKDTALPESVKSIVMELHLHKKIWRHHKSFLVVELLKNWECLRKPNIGLTSWMTWGWVTWGAWRRD